MKPIQYVKPIVEPEKFKRVMAPNLSTWKDVPAVYAVLKNDGSIKIGQSTNVLQRDKDYRTIEPNLRWLFAWPVPNATAYERVFMDIMTAQLETERVGDSEVFGWFEYEDDDDACDWLPPHEAWEEVAHKMAKILTHIDFASGDIEFSLGDNKLYVPDRRGGIPGEFENGKWVSKPKPVEDAA